MEAAAQARGGRRRVPALAPEERRAGLIEATLPLLHEHGPDVTTRQIAEAAGVAEGTIFGVFPDKASLLTAAVLAALGEHDGPERINPGRKVFDDIDPGLDLHDRLVITVRRVAERSQGRQMLIATVRRLPPEHQERVFAKLKWLRQMAMEGLVALMEPDRHRLRQSPATTARVLMTLIAAGSRNELNDEEPLTPEEIVTALLNGMLKEGA